MKDRKFNKLSSTWEHMKHGVPQGSVLGPLRILIYINDFPLTINKIADSILFADDMSIIISNTNPEEFNNTINSVMTEIMDWFQNNLLTSNYNKTTFLQFLTKKNKELKIHITASNSIITHINSTKFLGLILDSTLSWNDQIIALTSKLNKACYAIRAVKSCMSPDVLRTIYFSYVHSVNSYGIIFWGNSCFSTNIFKIQKRIIRIITNTGRRDSCRQLFKQLQILPLPSQYIYILYLFLLTRIENYFYQILKFIN